jgi:hypothetical protein
LRGRLREGGWWYYYPYALSVKMPLGTLALMALAGILFTTRPGDCQTRKTELVLLIVPLVVVLCFVTWSGSRQTLRYVLPIFPFAFIWAAKTGRLLSRNRRGPAILVTACLAWTAAGSLWVYPHSVSYFNALVGGPRHGHEHLIDANIDLGQDLLHLKRWYDAHPEARPFHLAYFGTVDPRYAGIQFSPPPRAKPSPLSGVESTADSWGPRPGWFAVSVHLLRIHRRPVPDGKGGFETAGGEDYDYFLHFRPVALAGYSVYLYQIECAEANRARRQLGMPTLACQDDLE